jgi:hypothetical protein
VPTDTKFGQSKTQVTARSAANPPKWTAKKKTTRVRAKTLMVLIYNVFP